MEDSRLILPQPKRIRDGSKFTGSQGRVLGKICLKKVSAPFFNSKKTLHSANFSEKFSKKCLRPLKFISKNCLYPLIFSKKVLTSLIFIEKQSSPPCQWSWPGYPLDFDPYLRSNEHTSHLNRHSSLLGLINIFLKTEILIFKNLQYKKSSPPQYFQEKVFSPFFREKKINSPPPPNFVREKSSFPCRQSWPGYTSFTGNSVAQSAA